MQSCGAFGLKSDTALLVLRHFPPFCPELWRKNIQNCYGSPSALPFVLSFVLPSLSLAFPFRRRNSHYPMGAVEAPDICGSSFRLYGGHDTGIRRFPVSLSGRADIRNVCRIVPVRVCPVRCRVPCMRSSCS